MRREAENADWQPLMNPENLEKPDKLHTFLRSRRSVRRFQPRPIPEDVLERILVTAVCAPSSHNRQPWRFIVLRSAGARGRLAELMGDRFMHDLLVDGLSLEEASLQVNRSRSRIREAPLVIVLCMDSADLDAYSDPVRQGFEDLMGAQSVALAGGTVLLAAHAEGLGGVWICAPLFAQEIVRASLDLPATWQPQGMLLLGYPAKIPERRERRPLAEVTVYR
jgi:coenzyme F420-0:L-glutamate ligase / coenzyme F420-1:gamma-L-glutamate ligase